MPTKLGNKYYKAREAQEKLGMTYSGLRYQVLVGNLKSVVPPNGKQAVYIKDEVDQLARALRAFMEEKRDSPAKLVKITTRDEMKECQEISQTLFGVGRHLVDERMKLLEKNPDTYRALKDKDQIVGCFSMMPLKPGRIGEILKQAIPVMTSADDLVNFDEEKDIDLYLQMIAVSPSFTLLERRIYGSRLISGMIELIIDFGKRGIKIGTIAARSNTSDGIRLMRHMGFTEVEKATPERRTFVIDVKASGIPYLLEYKNALKNAQE